MLETAEFGSVAVPCSISPLGIGLRNVGYRFANRMSRHTCCGNQRWLLAYSAVKYLPVGKAHHCDKGTNRQNEGNDCTRFILRRRQPASGE
jgi:hypothetical protein